MYPVKRFLLLILFFSGLSSPLFAQNQPDARTNKFQLADTFLRAGQFDRAVPMLEDLHADDPVNYTIFDKLRQAYVGLKRFEDALDLVEQRLLSDRTPITVSEKAVLLYKLGQEEEAYRIWDEAVSLAPDDLNTYRTIYYSFYRERLFEQGIRYLLEARKRFNDPAVFRNELAFSYSFSGQYEASMDEYLALLAENANWLSNVKSQVARSSDNPNALEAFVRSAEKAVRQDPLNSSLRELSAWLYVEQGAFDKALLAYRAIDQLQDENGLVMYNFAQTASDAGSYNIAAEAYQDIFDTHTDSPIAPNARFGLAEMYRKQADENREIAVDLDGNRLPAPGYQMAMDTYKSFLEDYPDHPLYPAVLFASAKMYQEIFFDLPDAEAAYTELTRSFPRNQFGFQSQYELGQIALTRNELQKARLYFNRLEQQLRTGELAELAQFEIAQLDFYEGQYASALVILDAMNRNTTTDIANDAIELKVILRENGGPDSLNTPLTRYARARLLERQRLPDQALAVLDSLVFDYPEHNIADEARYFRAGILRQLERFDESIEAYSDVQKDFSTSYLADRCLFAIAEIYEMHLHDYEKAIDLYADLLIKYPGSLLLPEVRTRIRRLRGDGV